MSVFKYALATALLAPVAISNAHAAVYAKVSVGQVADAEISGLSLGDGAAYGAALGTGLGPLRVEAGVNRITGDFAGGIVDANALDYHATAFMDLPVGEHASVFGGVGADYIDGEAETPGPSIDASGTGWHWAVGGAYRMNDRMIAEVQFRQIDAELDADFIGDVDLEASEVTIGFRLAL